MIVHSHEDVVPAYAACTLGAVSSRAVANLVEAPELLDVDVQQLTGVLSTHRGGFGNQDPPLAWIRDNRTMVKHERAASAAEHEIYISDAAELTATELAQERKAALAEQERLTWLSHTPEQLANRIPVSVFAMGNLADS